MKKKTLLMLRNTLVDSTNQRDSFELKEQVPLIDGCVYEGELDLSKDGEITSLYGFAYSSKHNQVYLNLLGKAVKL